jgi:hypothetical protein
MVGERRTLIPVTGMILARVSPAPDKTAFKKRSETILRTSMEGAAR